MNSIVEYDSAKVAENDYPERIISPPKSDLCCVYHLKQVGELSWERELPFVYRCCKTCGFTVRHFLSGVGRLSFEVTTPSRVARMGPPTSRRSKKRSHSRGAVSTHETVFDEGVRFALIAGSGRDARFLAERLEAMAG